MSFVLHYLYHNSPIKKHEILAYIFLSLTLVPKLLNTDY